MKETYCIYTIVFNQASAVGRRYSTTGAARTLVPIERSPGEFNQVACLLWKRSESSCRRIQKYGDGDKTDSHVWEGWFSRGTWRAGGMANVAQLSHFIARKCGIQLQPFYATLWLSIGQYKEFWNYAPRPAT